MVVILSGGDFGGSEHTIEEGQTVVVMTDENCNWNYEVRGNVAIFVGTSPLV